MFDDNGDTQYSQNAWYTQYQNTLTRTVPVHVFCLSIPAFTDALALARTAGGLARDYGPPGSRSQTKVERRKYEIRYRAIIILLAA